jgi:putative transposase
MPRKSYTIEQIISKLREAEVLLAQRQTAGEVCRSFNFIDQTYYRWRKEYGGIRTDQVRRLKELEKENARLTSSRCPSGRNWLQIFLWTTRFCGR